VDDYRLTAVDADAEADGISADTRGDTSRVAKSPVFNRRSTFQPPFPASLKEAAAGYSPVFD